MADYDLDTGWKGSLPIILMAVALFFLILGAFWLMLQ